MESQDLQDMITRLSHTVYLVENGSEKMADELDTVKIIPTKEEMKEI